MRSDVLETTGPDGLSLRAVFLWHVDRYRHVISVCERGGASTPLLESIEGSRADDWPPSPPLQSLHLETQPSGRRVALLVGMAGQSHWSASISPAANGTGLVFDLACRAGKSPGRLLTSYRIASEVLPAAADAATLRLECRGWGVTVAASADPATRSDLRLTEKGEFNIHPRESSETASPTRRWLYRVHLARVEARTECFVPSTE